MSGEAAKSHFPSNAAERAPQAPPVPVLPYATANTGKDFRRPTPFYLRNLPPDVIAAISTCCFLALGACSDSLTIWLVGLGCFLWYMFVRSRTRRNVPARWRWAQGLASIWAIGWAIRCLLLVASWTGWVEYVWEYNPPLQLSTAAVALGVLVAGICEFRGKAAGKRHISSSGPAVCKTPGRLLGEDASVGES